MFDHDPIALWLVTSAGAGIAAHTFAAWLYRRSYGRLRRSYAAAIAAAQRTGGDPDALVRAHELHRQFASARIPSWLFGFGAHLRNALVVGAIAGVAIAVALREVQPVVLGVVLLVAIGVRRLLAVTILLLVLFAASQLAAPRDRHAAPTTAAQLAAGSVGRFPSNRSAR